MMQNNSAIDVIHQLRNVFDYNNIEDYKTLLALIQQYYLGAESIEKYELYLLLNDVVKGFEKMENSHNFDRLYLYFVPKRLRRL